MTDYFVVYMVGFISWPMIVYICFPLLKKWLVKKWKLEPKKETAENEHKKKT